MSLACMICFIYYSTPRPLTQVWTTTAVCLVIVAVILNSVLASRIARDTPDQMRTKWTSYWREYLERKERGPQSTADPQSK